MNYLDLIRYFWLQHDTYSLGANEIALYFYLVKVNNSCYWKESFTRNNSKVRSDLGISSAVFLKSRKRLKEAELIEFQTQSGSAMTTYQLLPGKRDRAKMAKELAMVLGEVLDKVE